MGKVLIVDDNDDCAFLASVIVKDYTKDEIICAETVDSAIKLIDTNVKLVITDFNFPIGGFPSLLPTLQKQSLAFILHSADPDNIKIYDDKIQLGALVKGADYVSKLRLLLSSIKPRFSTQP